MVLVSATALNNSPVDLLNQILLFQDARASTIDGIDSIRDWFAPRISAFKRAMHDAMLHPESDYTSKIDAIYAEIQSAVMEKLTIRRTRGNIVNEPDYAADLATQGIVFPKIEEPRELTYVMDERLDALFWKTLDILKHSLHYARYRAIEFLLPPASEKYRDAHQVATILAGVYKTHMVKRLESSFYAFKKSIKTFLSVTEDMLRMFSENKVLVIPELDVSDLLDKGLELDDVVSLALDKHSEKYKTRYDLCYPASAFNPEITEMLKHDRDALAALDAEWDAFDYDPKLSLFVQNLRTEFFRKPFNPSGKLVVFSESVDTLEYLDARLRDELGRDDILLVHSGNRDRLRTTIRENFDANAAGQKDDFNIVLTSDVLSEGVNLHRASVIVNYDTPWNATRLMQRIGRVNRIGSTAPSIHNVLFYPSKSGNAAIGLYQNSVIKLQGFHSALGEDAKIYSHDEMLRVFHMFNENVRDSVDEALRFLRIARNFRASDPAAWERIKRLPAKLRVARKGAAPQTLVYLSSARRKEFYIAEEGKATQISSVEALKLLEAKPEDKAEAFAGEAAVRNYAEVASALSSFDATSQASSTAIPAVAAVQTKNKTVLAAAGFLRKCSNWEKDGVLRFPRPGICDALQAVVAVGAYQHLETSLAAIAKALKCATTPAPEHADEVADSLYELFRTYAEQPEDSARQDPDTDPAVVVSETFLP